MTTPPERQTSAAPIKVINPLIPGANKGSANLNMDIAKVQSNSVTMNQYLPIRSPLKSEAIVKTQGFTSGPYPESAEYALCVIGVLCIVYGIVAK